MGVYAVLSLAFLCNVCVAQYLRSSECFCLIDHVAVGGSREAVISLVFFLWPLVDFALDLSTIGLWFL